MKKIIIASLLAVNSCVALAQDMSTRDSLVIEPKFPLTELDTKSGVFCYYNDEWFAIPASTNVEQDSIQAAQVKNDQYGNRAVFFTVSPTYLAHLKAEASKVFINLDPRCEFPGGDGKFKEWIQDNLRIPKGYKGRERVVVNFKVHPDGSISSPRIIRPSKNEAANEEAIRLVNALPKFRVMYYVPSQTNKDFSYYIPIVFTEPGLIFIRGNESASTEANPQKNTESAILK